MPVVDGSGVSTLRGMRLTDIPAPPTDGLGHLGGPSLDETDFSLVGAAAREGNGWHFLDAGAQPHNFDPESAGLALENMEPHRLAGELETARRAGVVPVRISDTAAFTKVAMTGKIKWGIRAQDGEPVAVPATVMLDGKQVSIKHSVLNNGGKLFAAGMAEFDVSSGAPIGSLIDGRTGHYPALANRLQLGIGAFGENGFRFQRAETVAWEQTGNDWVENRSEYPMVRRAPSVGPSTPYGTWYNGSWFDYGGSQGFDYGVLGRSPELGAPPMGPDGRLSPTFDWQSGRAYASSGRGGGFGDDETFFGPVPNDGGINRIPRIEDFYPDFEVGPQLGAGNNKWAFRFGEGRVISVAKDPRADLSGEMTGYRQIEERFGPKGLLQANAYGPFLAQGRPGLPWQDLRQAIVTDEFLQGSTEFLNQKHDFVFDPNGIHRDAAGNPVTVVRSWWEVTAHPRFPLTDRTVADLDLIWNTQQEGRFTVPDPEYLFNREGRIAFVDPSDRVHEAAPSQWSLAGWHRAALKQIALGNYFVGARWPWY